MTEHDARALAERIGRDYGWAHTGGGIWTAQREDEDGSVVWNVSLDEDTLLMSVEVHDGSTLLIGYNFVGRLFDLSRQVADTEEAWETNGTAYTPCALREDSRY